MRNINWKHMGIASLLAVSALTLAACAGMTWQLTVGGCIGGPCQPAKQATKSMTATDVAAVDASTMSMTYTSSGGIVSDPGVFTVSVLSGGSTLAASTFAYTRSGNNFAPANPSAVSAWIQSYAGSIDEVDIELDNMVIAEVDGSNSVSVTAYYGGGSIGNSSSTWLHHNNF